jgi:sterol 24-C-methyltransferase
MEDHLGEALQVKPGDQVLDAGCGIGHVAIRTASLGVHVQAIDITTHHVAKARQNVRARNLEQSITVQQMDYHDLSKFPDGEFDAVYTMETFVHAHNPAHVLSEFFRVMKPGGRLVMREYDHISSKMDARSAKAMAQVNDLSAMPGAQMFDEGVLEKFIQDAGYERIVMEDISSRIVPLAWLFYIVASVPYMFVKLLHLEKVFINAMCAVEAYKLLDKGYARYISISALKPEGKAKRKSVK